MEPLMCHQFVEVERRVPSRSGSENVEQYEKLLDMRR